jgi:hypothetical protein
MTMEDLSHIALDPRPGNYYASVRDPENPDRLGFLLGPYKTHQEALDMVNPAQEMANKVNSWAAFYAFGTCRLPEDYPNPPQGKLNDLLEAKDGEPSKETP